MTEASSDFSSFFEVRIELFDGPLDLLLHLVKKRELPIERVALAEVCSQYLECVRHARYLDLELAGEYLVIASTLLAIKASVLLDEPIELVPDEDGNLVDPQEELLERLKRLEAYRAAAGLLETRPMLGTDVFASIPKAVKIDASTVPLGDHEISLLEKALRKVLSRVQNTGSLTISIENVSVVERMRWVVDHLREAQGPVGFEDLIPDKTSRGSIIATFVALLELCKRSAIQVRQDASYGEIVVALAGEGTVDTSTPIDSVDEEMAVANV